jgi:hypothetical protein
MLPKRYQDAYGSWDRTSVSVAPDFLEPKRIVWSAIFAGVVVVLAVQLLLALLGIGIGMTTLDPASGESPSAGAFSLGATIWWAITALLALAAGGWVAGHLANKSSRLDGALHGVITWGIATLLTFYLLTSAVGSLIGGTFSVVGSAVSAVGQGAQTAVESAGGQGGGPLQAIRQQAEQALGGNGQGLPPRAGEILDRIIRGDISGEELQTAAARMAQQYGIPESEARQRLEGWQQQYRQAREQAPQQARQVADTTANVIAQAALWSFVALLLGAAVAAGGGVVGSPGWDRY